MRTIIVTGSEGLIGKPLSDYLEHYNHVIRLDLALGHDLTNEDTVKALFRENRANGLINLFAINHHITTLDAKNTDPLEVSLSEIRDYHRVNVEALFSVCREFIKSNSGNIKILNFGSLYSVRAPKRFLYHHPKHIGYVTSKHAVIGLTRYLATHFDKRVCANVICPGGIRADNIDRDFEEGYCLHVPLLRMGKPDDLFGIVDLLISDKSNYINGAVIPVDGGWTTW